MTIDPENERHIIADEGKQFRRIVSQEEYGKEIYMGWTYYIGGVLQDPPHWDEASDFEEIDYVEPEDDKHEPHNAEAEEENDELDVDEENNEQ